MKEAITAKAYALAMMKLGEEAKIDATEEMTRFHELASTSNDLENLLFLDVFSIEERAIVLKEIFSKITFSQVTRNFVFFLLQEKRLNLLPLIFKELIVFDDHKKGFIRGVVEGTENIISEEDLQSLVQFLKKELNLEPKLDYQMKTTLSAGYKVTVEDLQLDATLDHQLHDLRESIINNKA